MTTGDVLNDQQQSVFEKFIQGGKGFVGLHSASDTEYDWPWYGQLVGAYFKNHPGGNNAKTELILLLEVQEARIVVEMNKHPIMFGFPEEWVTTDEWYNFQSNPSSNPEYFDMALIL